MQKKIISGRDLSKAITSDDILGKEVLDSEGKTIGVSEKILIDKNDFNLIGIGVDKGFLKKGLTIGRAYIDKVTPHAVFLKTKIAYNLRGMKVFDKEGKKIGTVSKVFLFGTKNRIKEIEVQKNPFKKIIISKELIDVMDENIILNVMKKELTSNSSQSS